MPPENVFDQICRYLASGAGPGLLPWLLGVAPDKLTFVRWLNTRLTLPGQPERVSDTIAHIQSVAQDGMPWAIPLEFQTEPDPLMFGRLLVYAGLLWLTEKPTALTGDRFELQPVVVNLTGLGHSGRRMVWREGAGVALEPIEWDLQTLDAAKVLEQVASGAVPRLALAWIPLMQQGGEEAIIQRWLEIAGQETDPQRRADLALVRVFAQLTGQTAVWNQALEGFNVKQSTLVNQWIAEATAAATVAAKAESVREVLESRFGVLPADLLAVLGRQCELDVLKVWTTLVGRVASLEEFRQKAGI